MWARASKLRVNRYATTTRVPVMANFLVDMKPETGQGPLPMPRPFSFQRHQGPLGGPAQVQKPVSTSTVNTSTCVCAGPQARTCAWLMQRQTRMAHGETPRSGHGKSWRMHKRVPHGHAPGAGRRGQGRILVEGGTGFEKGLVGGEAVAKARLAGCCTSHGLGDELARWRGCEWPGGGLTAKDGERRPKRQPLPHG